MFSGPEWNMPEHLQVHGTAVKKELNFIENSARQVGSIASRLRAYVKNAAFNMKRLRVMGTRNFATGHVDLDGGRKTELITNRVIAWLVGKNSKPSDQKASSVAPVSVLGLSAAGRADVFNITVEEENEYYANGVLVHNCDALVWAMTELFPKLTKRVDNKGRRPSKANSVYPVHKWRQHG